MSSLHLTRKSRNFSTHSIKTKFLKSAIIVATFSFAIFQICLNITASEASPQKSPSTTEINPAYTTTQEMKVLVIEINPRLKTISGQPKAADLLHSVENIAEIAVNEQIGDLEWASHGYLNIKTIWEYVDDFPHYKTSFTLPDGTTGYAFDEENYLMAADDGSGNYSWWNLNNNGWLGDKIPAFSFDYDWIFERLDLVNRRNNGEFDQVWLVSIDPTQSFEVIMAGRNPYYLNGEPYEADCDNFIFGGASMSRRDSQLHAYAHGVESIMGIRSLTHPAGVYQMSYDSYVKDSINISTKEEYLALNPWERFVLNDYANSGALNGIGNIHFPFNARYDYDYSNDRATRTTFLEWRDFGLEDAAGDFISTNRMMWDSSPYNDGGPNLPGGRYFTRFWLSLFPHETGYTKDGYLKNWWKYIYSADYVTDISSDETEHYGAIGDNFDLTYTLNFKSNHVEPNKNVTDGNNVDISNPEVVNFIDGQLRAIENGESSVKVSIDGKNIEYNITVSPEYASGASDSGNAPDEPTHSNPIDNKQELPPSASDYSESSSESLAAPDTGEETKQTIGATIAVTAPVFLTSLLLFLKKKCII